MWSLFFVVDRHLFLKLILEIMSPSFLHTEVNILRLPLLNYGMAVFSDF